MLRLADMSAQSGQFFVKNIDILTATVTYVYLRIYSILCKLCKMFAFLHEMTNGLCFDKIISLYFGAPMITTMTKGQIYLFLLKNLPKRTKIYINRT
jgi:hypothetical protein